MPVLEMQSARPVLLRRPHLAAIGCWILILSLLIVPIHVLPAISADFICAATLFAVGMAAIGDANVAGETINPTPRRLAIIFFVLASLLYIGGAIYYASTPDPAADGSVVGTLENYRKFAEDASRIIRNLASWNAAAHAFQILGWSFALGYVIQLSRITRKPWLRSLGLLVIGFALFAKTVAALSSFYAVLTGSFFTSSRPRSGIAMIYRLLPNLELLALLLFFTICAIALHRARHEVGPDPHPTP